MTKRKTNEVADTQQATRIILMLQLAGTLPSPERLGRLVAETDVSSVILFPNSESPAKADQLKPVVAVLQHNDTAVLIADDIELAETVSADGVHLSHLEDDIADDLQGRYKAARKALGPTAIVGVDVGTSRHDAMALGDDNADYVAFSPSPAAPGPAAKDDDEDPDNSFDDPRELIAWWAEIFEPPVVALFANDLDDACELASIGADFVGLRLPAGLSPADEIEWLQNANARLAEAKR